MAPMRALIVILLLIALVLPMLGGIRRLRDLPRDAPLPPTPSDDESP